MELQSLQQQSARPPVFPASPYAVRLEFFAGPLDLLLHLVNQQEVSIEQVEMARVAEQYLEIIMSAEELDLHVAAEYLVVASTLMAIKSSSLLGTHEPQQEGEQESTEFYEELRKRLKRYEEVKRQALELRQLPQLGVDTFIRRDLELIRPVDGQITVEKDAHELGVFFVRLLKRIGATVETIRIQLEPISVVAFMMKIIQTMQASLVPSEPKGTFFGLLKTFVIKAENADYQQKRGLSQGAEISQQARAERVSLVVGTFIATLELIKRGLLRAKQRVTSEEIELELAMFGAGVNGEKGQETFSLESKFDQDLERAAENKVVHLSNYVQEREKLSVDATEEIKEELKKEVNRE